MRNKRQKTQLELAFPAVVAGEARHVEGRGTEFRAAGPTPESPAVVGPRMEEVLDRENLRKALRAVRRNKGAPGMDGMTVDELPAHLEEHWPALRDRLLGGTYTPQPVRRVMIPKVSGGERPLGIPTVVDRLIQQAALQVLQRQWDPTFSEHSYGFRPGRSAHQAVARAQEHVAAGHGWVVDLDLAQFFDRVNHDRLMARVAQRVEDKRLLKLIRGFLTAGVMEGGVVGPRVEGTPQGGPLSPLLSNILLTDLDRELEKRGHCFCRYADDCNVYVGSRRGGQRVMAEITAFLEQRLKLKVNADKSAVARPWQRKFLGYSVTWHRKPKLKIALPSRQRLAEKIRQTLRGAGGKSLRQVIAQLNPVLRGWVAYFRLTEERGVLEEIDGWLRRKLRALLWRQWKRVSTRAKHLMRAGLNHERAWQSATNGHGPWWNGGSSHMNAAYPTSWFERMGLISLLATQRRFSLVS